MKQQLINPVWGSLLFVIGIVLFTAVPPVYNKAEMTTLDWVALVILLTGIAQIVVSLLFRIGGGVR